MRPYARELVARHRSVGVVLDANLLLLLVIGQWDIRRVETFRRTRNHFLAGDYSRLTDLLVPLERIVTTPHILTEVSNLANQIEGRDRDAVYGLIAASLARLTIHDVSTRAVAATAEFRRFGLTDSVIIQLAREEMLILTIDFPLANYLQAQGLAALNYTTLSVANIPASAWS